MVAEAPPKYEPPTLFLKAIAWQESKWNPLAFNKSENAVGIYQIRPIYLEDVKRFTPELKDMSHDDCYNQLLAEEVVSDYIQYWTIRYHDKKGKPGWSKEELFRIMAAIHNGGPNGPDKLSTKKYCDDIIRHMKEQPWND